MQSGLLHSQPKSTVGTPAYIAPEVLSRKEYDGKVYIRILKNSLTKPEASQELNYADNFIYRFPFH